MELIVIDENKLKIMLTAPDMQHYELRAERMSGADAETRRAFRHIFDDAREKIGFDTEGERLLVQLYTSRGGGCEIFVTKLGTEEGKMPLPYDRHHAQVPTHEDALLEQIRERSDPAHPEADRTEIETGIWRFSDLSCLAKACRRLVNAGYKESSELFQTTVGGEDIWYLSLCLPVPRPLRYAFLSEYAEESTDPDMLSLYLGEHACRIASEYAVEGMEKV